MRRLLLLVLPILVVCSLSGAAQATQTAPAYDARFNVGEDVYSGTTTFVVDAKGVVTGTMKLLQPTEVNAMLAGAVKDGTWTFSYGYEIPAQGCSGTVSGAAKVDAAMKSVTGTVTIGGGCTEEPMQATFSFTRREK